MSHDDQGQNEGERWTALYFSGHHLGIAIDISAYTLGANWIERHFTLDRTFEGPDHILSSEPKEFSELVSISKKIPSILGNGVKRIQPNEYDTINTQRKRIETF